MNVNSFLNRGINCGAGLRRHPRHSEALPQRWVEPSLVAGVCVYASLLCDQSFFIKTALAQHARKLSPNLEQAGVRSTEQTLQLCSIQDKRICASGAKHGWAGSAGVGCWCRTWATPYLTHPRTKNDEPQAGCHVRITCPFGGPRWCGMVQRSFSFSETGSMSLATVNDCTW